MRSALKGLLILLLCSPAWASFALVQSKQNGSCTTTSQTCAVTVTSTGTGNLMIVSMHNLIGEAITGVSGGGTWSLCASSTCSSVDGGTRAVDLAYCLSSTSGTTSVTVTRTSTTSGAWAVKFVEVSFTNGPIALDVVGVRQQTTVANPVTGVGLTLTGTNDYIYQAIRAGQNVTAISSPYTDPAAANNGNPFDFGGAVNQSTGTAPSWTLNGTGRAAMSAIAIKETGAISSTIKHQSQVF